MSVPVISTWLKVAEDYSSIRTGHSEGYIIYYENITIESTDIRYPKKGLGE